MTLIFDNILRSATDLPWLKFIPLIAAFTIAICEAFTRKTERKWLHRFFIPLISLIALAASCWIVRSDDKTARESKAGENAHLDRIEGKLGDEEATKRYLDAVGDLTRQLTVAKTGNSVDKFFDSKNERQKLREDVNRANQKLLLAHEIRINPVRDYIIGKFDTWISGIRKRGITVRVNTGEVPTVQIGVRANGLLRSGVFENTDTAQLQCWSAAINDGHLTEEFQCRIDFIFNRGNADAMIFHLVVDESNYQILSTRPRFKYKPYSGRSDNPIEDKEFIATLDDALDEAMAFAVEEATASK